VIRVQDEGSKCDSWQTAFIAAKPVGVRRVQGSGTSDDADSGNQAELDIPSGPAQLI
jgi:hypothetical protein